MLDDLRHAKSAVSRNSSAESAEKDDRRPGLRVLGLGVHVRVLFKLADANDSKLRTLKVRLQRERQIHAHPL